MHQCDLDFVTRLHREEFPSNVVSRFGALLVRAYYVSFVTSPHAVAYVVELDGRVAGYLVGIVRLRQHRRRLLRRHLLRLAPAAALGALMHPALAVALTRARLARRGTRAGEAGGSRPSPPDGVQSSEPVVAVLSHVAVAREGRGRGLGAALVAQFEREAAASGVTRLCLATTDDSGAGAFYEHRGWALAARRLTFDQRPISLYELDLPTRRITTCAESGSRTPPL